ncbi:DNA recombination protein RmuC [Micrococcoides hystricis]|uniref:DNA recombination protein RmuC n=1 Tax=Micrococcoides hystricis TaxID=1572761 RepID=A0ABV6PA14_9MICC
MDPVVLTLIVVLVFIVGLVAGLGLAIFLQRRNQAQSPTPQALEAKTHELAAAKEELARAQTQADQLRERLGESQQANQTNLSVLNQLHPISTQLRQMTAKVSALEEERHQQYGSLQQQLQVGTTQHQQLLSVTTELATAMKDNRARGSWGELALQRILELSGLHEGSDFTSQLSVATAEKTDRPDVVVHLPQDRQLIIDAKTIGLFDRTDEEEVAAAVASLRNHVRQLSKKSYWQSLPDATEYVVLFLPFDSQLTDCISADPQLLDDALAANIVLAGPTALYAVLKNVAVTWRQTRVHEDAQTILELSTTFYERISVLGNHLENLGKSLNSSVRNYNSMVNSVQSRLLPTGRQLSAYKLAQDQKLEDIAELDSATVQPVAAELTSTETDQ